MIGIGFGDNGVPVDQTSRTYTLILKKESYERVMSKGFVYDFSFPVKKPGAYQLRVALRDHGSDKLGSANQFVEVPNLKKGRIVLSGVVLENLPYTEWQKREAGQQIPASNPLNDTSLRQFKRGTVVTYGFSIYNAKAVGAAPNLSYQTRIFRDGKPIFEGSMQPVVAMPGDDPRSLAFSAALGLGAGMLPGDYVLQVVIIDNTAKQNRNTATQFVTFEIVE